jgi:hydroxypyruvate isomerase
MKRPPIKDKAILEYVEFLEAEKKEQDEQLKKILHDPRIDIYVNMKKAVTHWAKELGKCDISMLNEEDKPKFEMAHKFATEVGAYTKEIMAIHKDLTADQKAEAEKALAASAGIAETLAGKHNAKQN